MRSAVFFAVAMLSWFTSPADAAEPLEEGFAGALRGCEEWVLNPKTWADGLAPFVASVGLGNKMGLVERVDSASLPPKALRRANHYWRINSTPGAGYVLVVSDQLPMCHITGGGDADLQPAVEAVLASPSLMGRWKRGAEETRGNMVTTVFQHLEDPAFSMVVSRARTVGQQLARVQVMATATYKLAD